MKSDYRSRAIRFLRAIIPYLDNDIFNPDEVEEKICEFNRAKNRKIVVSWGSARIALITSDYVIKWDYDRDNVHEIGGCADEYYAYQQAKEQGFGYLLAESTLIMVNDIEFSIMPRISYVGPQYHYKGSIENYLTEEEFDWLTRFSKDLHHYNWGIRQGKACVIDYAMTNEVYERGSWSE